MRTVKLGDVARLGSGGTPRRSNPEYFGEGLPWLSIADLNDGIVTEAKESLTPAGVENSSAKAVPAGTVLVAMYGSIGKLAITGREMCTSQAIAFVIPAPDTLDTRYLFHYLLNARPHLQSRGRGGTQSNIGQADLKALPIPLPPIEEQRRVAAILDQADAIRTKRRQVLTHLDALPVSALLHRFGDPDHATRSVPFGQVARLSAGRNLVAEDQTQETPFRVLKISAVTSGVFRAAESKSLPPDYIPPASHLVRPGDLLMSRANTAELVGATALVGEVPPNLALPDKVWRFEWESPDTDPLFMHSLLSVPSIRRRISRLASGTGGSMKNVPKEKLMRMPIPEVPATDQRDFADTVRSVHSSRASVEKALARDEALFASLQSRAFRGEL